MNNFLFEDFIVFYNICLQRRQTATDEIRLILGEHIFDMYIFFKYSVCLRLRTSAFMRHSKK